MKAVLSSVCSSWSSQICEFISTDPQGRWDKWPSTVYIIPASASLLQCLRSCTTSLSQKWQSSFISPRQWQVLKSWKNYHRQNTKQSLEVRFSPFFRRPRRKVSISGRSREQFGRMGEVQSDLRDHMLCVTGGRPGNGGKLGVQCLILLGCRQVFFVCTEYDIDWMIMMMQKSNNELWYSVHKKGDLDI